GPAVSAAGPVTGLALSPDGRTLAMAGDGVQLWQTASGQRAGAQIPPAGKSADQAVAFSPDGKTLATLGTDGTARLWDAATGRPDGAPMAASRPGALAGQVA